MNRSLQVVKGVVYVFHRVVNSTFKAKFNPSSYSIQLVDTNQGHLPVDGIDLLRCNELKKKLTN